MNEASHGEVRIAGASVTTSQARAFPMHYRMPNHRAFWRSTAYTPRKIYHIHARSLSVSLSSRFSAKFFFL